MSSTLSRRTVLAGAAATATAAAGVAGVADPAAADTISSPSCQAPAPPSVVVPPSDGRYGDLVRNWNGRFTGSPDYVQVVNTTGQVEQAVQAAVRARKQLAVRSGGHCVEGFVTDPSVKAQIDMSGMNDISFDPRYNAFSIQPGATLRDVFKRLYTEWGVTVPGGSCPSVGVGGHFAGGGFGALARRNGIVPDHMYGVEVVTVTASGKVKTVLATRERDDPNRELFWGYTGGGGGNFGVVTRYLMRSWNATGNDPTRLLPAPPKASRTINYIFPWPALPEPAFIQLLTNYMAWYLRNSAPDSPYTGLSASLIAPHVNTYPFLLMTVVVDPTEPNSADLVAGFKSAVIDPVGTPVVQEATMPWLMATNKAGFADTGDAVGRRNKAKGAYLKGLYTPEQLSTTYRYLTATPAIKAPLAAVMFNPYGGQANALPSDATAVPQRDSVLKVMHTVHWDGAALDGQMLGWLRDFYRDVYSATGGVPVPNAVTDGSFINYADVDLADPTLNTSGVPWSTLYYKDAYPRLQRVKARWDPTDTFRHALSIRLP
ncbi:FAD-binding protein [Dactylosporangium sp. NPDC049525]|uniref:FAD-binding oxidoreductase n=1 Tax=Dactylosporangium sp. NPDC049525 TaxID=3154730 RepID=UPI003447A809